MTNPNEPVSPVIEMHQDDHGVYKAHLGLTKREYFALHIMAGMCADPSRSGPVILFASFAVDAADVLIYELNKERKEI
jgi:hypothetical protein